MAFSAVFQFMPGDEAGRGRWLIEHYLEHMEFYKELMGQTPSRVTINYPIQRMDIPEDWLDAHQKMTQSVWSALGGGQSSDFADLDWENENMVQDWMYQHYLWHQSVREQLGL